MAQPGTTAYLDALPTRLDRVIDSPQMLTLVQRQLGLPLSVLSGLPCDPFGDKAVNSNNDYTIRHNTVLDAWVKALRRCHRGRKVQRGGFLDSECHPDGTIYDHPSPGRKTFLEAKVLSSLDSRGMPKSLDSEMAAFAGLTGPSGHEIVADIDAKYEPHLASSAHKLYHLITDAFGAIHPVSRRIVVSAAARQRRSAHGAASADPLGGGAPPSADEPGAAPRSLFEPISIAAHVAIASHIHRYADQCRSDSSSMADTA